MSPNALPKAFETPDRSPLPHVSPPARRCYQAASSLPILRGPRLRLIHETGQPHTAPPAAALAWYTRRATPPPSVIPRARTGPLLDPDQLVFQVYPAWYFPWTRIPAAAPGTARARAADPGGVRRQGRRRVLPARPVAHHGRAAGADHGGDGGRSRETRRALRNRSAAPSNRAAAPLDGPRARVHEFRCRCVYRSASCEVRRGAVQRRSARSNRSHDRLDGAADRLDGAADRLDGAAESVERRRGRRDGAVGHVEGGAGRCEGAAGRGDGGTGGAEDAVGAAEGAEGCAARAAGRERGAAAYG